MGHEAIHEVLSFRSKSFWKSIFHSGISRRKQIVQTRICSNIQARLVGKEKGIWKFGKSLELDRKTHSTYSNFIYFFFSIWGRYMCTPHDGLCNSVSRIVFCWSILSVQQSVSGQQFFGQREKRSGKRKVFYRVFVSLDDNMKSVSFLSSSAEE